MHTSSNIYKPSTNLINFNIMFRSIWIWKIELLKTFTPKKTIQYDYERVIDLSWYNLVGKINFIRKKKTSNKNNLVFNN